jgi:hypothetical protein
MEFLFSIVGNRLTISLNGTIDGKFKLTRELNKILKDNDHISEVVFVLRKVKEMNEDGIKVWSEEIGKLAETGYVLTFIECPNRLLDPILKMDKGNSRAIRSFVVTYYCSSCNEEYPQLINTSSMTLSFNSYTKPHCPNCDKRLSLDITEDEVERIISLLPVIDSYRERRKYPRFDVSASNFRTTITKKSDGESHSFTLVNFSEAGLCLRGKHFYTPGENVAIEFSHKGHKVQSEGVVVWYSMESDSEYLMGLSLWTKDLFNTLIKL